MISSLKFFAGFLSNLACQLVRSLCNFALSIVLLSASAVMLMLCILRAMGGGFSVAKSSALKAWSLVTLASARLGVGTLQALGCITMTSPAVRASQACMEEIWPKGIYAPNGKGRTKLQDIFGINAWHQEENSKSETNKEESEDSILTTLKESKKQPNRTKNTRPKKKSQNISDRKWESLVEDYLKARSIEDADRVRTIMARNHPVEYLNALVAARESTSRNKRRVA